MKEFLMSYHQVKSLFTDTFTLVSAGIINTQIFDRKTEFLHTLPVASLESFPLQCGLTDIACGLLTDNISLDTSSSTTNSCVAAW